MNIAQAILNRLGRRQLSQITTIFMHHSVADPALDIEQIAAMEQASQGFATVGYNAYIKRDGLRWVVQEGRPIGYIPAAQYGMNTEGYALCIGGNYQPGGASFLTLLDYHALAVAASHIVAVKAKCPNLHYLAGHRDVATIKEKAGLNPGDFSTACPGDKLYAQLDNLRAATGLKKRPELL